MSFYFGLLAIFGYCRLLIGFSVTETFGPIISTIIFMFNDVAIFIVIWGIVIFMFTSVSIMMWQEVEVFFKFDTALLFWI